MTNDASRCEMYQAESQNVKSRFACVLPSGYIQENLNEDDPIIPITQAECEVRPPRAWRGRGGWLGLIFS